MLYEVWLPVNAFGNVTYRKHKVKLCEGWDFRLTETRPLFDDGPQTVHNESAVEENDSLPVAS
mgnify:FL=1